jgi:hypothetical protein
MVKVQGLREIILIKEGAPASEEYIVEVLAALCPEVVSIKNLMIYPETSGNFTPDETYVITRLIIRKGKNFDIVGKTQLQQYTDKQGQHGWLVYVYGGKISKANIEKKEGRKWINQI